MRRRDFLAGSTAGAMGLLAIRTAGAQEASNTAKQAFSFAYPLMLMDLTHRVMAGGGSGDQPAPFNRFFHYPQLPTEQFTALVCPVADAIHSSAWLNVKDEPMVVSIPAVGSRFCTGSFFHAWYDVLGRIGSGPSKGKATDFLVTGPGWTGEAPKGTVQISSPTNVVWAPLWISVSGPEDLPAAVALQTECRVTPLKDWKGPKPTGSGIGGSLASLIGSFLKKPEPAGPPAMPGPGGEAMPAEGQPMPPAAPKVDADGNVVPQPSSAMPAEGVPQPMPGAEGTVAGDPGGGSMTGIGGNGTSPNTQLFSMEAAAFYNRFCQLMVENPPLEADATIVAKIAKLGLTPGATIDLMTQSRANQMALVGAVRNAGQKIFTTKGGMKLATGNRWETALNSSDFGTNYDRKAYTALMYFGASDPAEVLCPRTSKDGTGRPLQGQQKYTLTFTSNQLPPAGASWSLTAYKAPTMELGASAGGKHAVCSHQDLVKNPDGGLTIYVQKDSPGAEKEANWLPVPAEGAFELMLRLCGPKAEVASLAWKPPAVTKA